jgi:hypothetical protein
MGGHTIKTCYRINGYPNKTLKNTRDKANLIRECCDECDLFLLGGDDVIDRCFVFKSPQGCSSLITAYHCI